MAYTLDINLALGSGKAGIADLRAQLVDTVGANVGAAVSTGFVEIGAGNYLWHYGAFPDAHRGGVKFYSAAVPGTVLAFLAVNPEEAERIDVDVSSRAQPGDTMAALLADGSINAGTFDSSAITLIWDEFLPYTEVPATAIQARYAVGMGREILDRLSTLYVKLNAMIEVDGGDWRFDANSLELAPGGSAPTVGEIDTQLSGTHGAGAWGSGGGGVNAVTFTIQDNTAPTPLRVPNLPIVIRSNDGLTLLAYGVSDSNGQLTVNLNNSPGGSPYKVYVLTTPEFDPLAVQSLVVDGVEAATYTLIRHSPVAPAAPGLCRVEFYVYVGGIAVPNARVEAFFISHNQATNNTLQSLQVNVDTTDAAGYADLQLIRTDYIAKGDGIYRIRVTDAAGKEMATKDTTIPAVATINFEDLL